MFIYFFKHKPLINLLCANKLGEGTGPPPLPWLMLNAWYGNKFVSTIGLSTGYRKHLCILRDILHCYCNPNRANYFSKILLFCGEQKQNYGITIKHFNHNHTKYIWKLNTSRKCIKNPDGILTHSREKIKLFPL